MMRVLAFATLLLGACGDLSPGYHSYSCYPGETCSRDTPDGLVFRGTDITGQLGGMAGRTAVGGTQNVKVLDPTDDLTSPVVFALPYTTDTSQPSDDRFAIGAEVIGHEGHVVTVRGIADGYNYLRLLSPDGELYDRTILSANPVDHRQVRPPYEYGGPDDDETVVWVPGEHDVSVGLWTAPDPLLANYADPLVDESMTLSLLGGTQTRWDTIRVPAAPVGHRALAVTAGSGSVVLDVETVAAPDGIENAQGNYYPLSIYGSDRLCFVARHGTRYVAGARWSFTMDDGQVLTTEDTDTPRTGCAYFAASKQGTVHIHATASGFTQTLDVIAH